MRDILAYLAVSFLSAIGVMYALSIIAGRMT